MNAVTTPITPMTIYIYGALIAVGVALLAITITAIVTFIIGIRRGPPDTDD